VSLVLQEVDFSSSHSPPNRTVLKSNQTIRFSLSLSLYLSIYLSIYFRLTFKKDIHNTKKTSKIDHLEEAEVVFPSYPILSKFVVVQLIYEEHFLHVQWNPNPTPLYNTQQQQQIMSQ
jgi:hypothetical protein